MTSLPVLHELPDGYTVEVGERGVLALDRELGPLLQERGYGPESDVASEPSDLEGRRPLGEFEAGGQRLLIRRFTHGGLARWLTRRRFLDAERPFRELILSDSLRRSGIRTPRVVAARARSAGVGWELEIVTRCVEGTLDVGRVMGLARAGRLPFRARRRLLLALGELVGRLHDGGCRHADLQPNNVLVNEAALEGAEPELWILDLDRSTLGAPLDARWRTANLERLFRHVVRREQLYGAVLTRADCARFCRGYDPEGRRWRALWRGVARRHARRLVWHRLGWWLERVAGGSPDEPRHRDSGPVTRPRGAG